ncbi:hypothetical protein IMX26_09585 [Clostridium sp. 'deep sea']|uniref:DUF6754 domain-containing protein n=1 Tax=Clostridium sp. 'deep sea' TaxID=2779445 RepID=UPI001896520C|nr:DUF6754 domain-containing protein [Clostridium sp. 'deep sea']QOR33753.1 hypothetical protein IMX26_09585 [Clostridium sp. 'deep sea']
MKSEVLFQFISLILISGAIIYCIQRAHSGAQYKIRLIAGLEAIEEAVGRATEMGRMVHFTPGIAGVDGVNAAQTFAGLETLGMVARLVARYGARLFVSIRIPIVLPLAEEIVKQAYMSEGAVEAYDQECVQYLSSEQFAYAAAVMGIIQREKAAASILLGAFWAESLMIAEAGFHAGAIQIAGSANIHQIPFFVAACDYVLIGEELYAAGAIASGNPVKLGSIAGQDLSKLYVMIILVVGVIAITLGSDFMVEIMNK